MRHFHLARVCYDCGGHGEKSRLLGDRSSARHLTGSSAMAERRRTKQAQSLKPRLLDRVKSLREEARLTRPGFERDALLRKARQTETASHIEEWLSSSRYKTCARSVR